ncbi:hypothetical protein, partial [Acinetobacter baumannii]
MAEQHISGDLIASENDRRGAAQSSDFEALGAHLARRNIDIEAITAKVADFFVAVPSWGVGTGG